MSTFLQLCQRTKLECGVSGTDPLPSAVTGQTGEMLRIVTWVAESWIDIQNAHRDWKFLRNSASFTTVASQGEYELGTGAGTIGVLAANFGMWVPDTGRAYLTATGTSDEQHLEDIDYDHWRDTYLFGSNRTNTGRPWRVAVGPDNSLCLGTIPAAGYTVTKDYYRSPVTLTANGDTPAMPAQFHTLIVYGAMKMYAAYEAAPEVMARATEGFEKLMRRLTVDQLPQPTWGGGAFA